MAMSTCVKCGGHRFEVKENEPTGAMFKLLFIQCSGCGGVVGVTEYFNIGATLGIIADKLGIRL